MKKFVALLAKEKWLIMKNDEKMMTLTFLELYTVYIKFRTAVFPYLLVNLFKEKYISSVKSYKYLNTLRIKTMVLTCFEILCICAQFL